VNKNNYITQLNGTEIEYWRWN